MAYPAPKTLMKKKTQASLFDALCVVPGCKGSYRKGLKLHVFGFPKDLGFTAMDMSHKEGFILSQQIQQGSWICVPLYNIFCQW